jgi:hypothetical protein
MWTKVPSRAHGYLPTQTKSATTPDICKDPKRTRGCSSRSKDCSYHVPYASHPYTSISRTHANHISERCIQELRSLKEYHRWVKHSGDLSSMSFQVLVLLYITSKVALANARASPITPWIYSNLQNLTIFFILCITILIRLQREIPKKLVVADLEQNFI